jgi:hypothetical protein
MFVVRTSGLYYKHVTIVNDDSRVMNMFEASLTDDARVIICDHHMFIVQEWRIWVGTCPPQLYSLSYKLVFIRQTLNCLIASLLIKTIVFAAFTALRAQCYKTFYDRNVQVFVLAGLYTLV